MPLPPHHPVILLPCHPVVMIDSMLQVLPHDRASIDELISEGWTCEGLGPLPNVTSDVVVDCDGAPSSRTGSPAYPLGGATMTSTAAVRRYATYLAYTALVAGALWFSAAREHGAGVALADD